MAKSKISKAQVGVKSGKTEQEVRSAILKKADEIFKSGKKPYKVPDEITQGSYLTGRKVCIQGVCGILSDAGFIPEDYYTNTKFAEKANELGFGYPITDINRLKPGDVFQHFTEKNEQGNYYPTHGEIFKGWNKEGEAEFYDYYDYYNYPLGMSEGIRTYSKDELMERLKRRAEKDNSGKQAQFFSIAGNFPTKKSFPYNLPEGELQQYFDKTHASKVRYAAPQSNIDVNSPLYTLSGEDVRQGTKNVLVDSFNDSQLDSQLKKNLKITDQDLQRIKPLVYGIVGQETQFNSPKSGLGNLKYTLENLFQLEGTSLGPGQIKLNSISKDTRKKFNINKNKDLLDPKNTYIGLVDILSKAANITDKHITPESHPELVDKDRYERALYFVNSPGKVRKTDKQLSEDVMKKSPWWNDFSERKMESNIRKAKNAPLRMDATSYPGKVVSKSGELEKDINFEDVGVLPEVSVTAPAKKQKNGGWLDKYQDGGEYLGTTNKGFDYNGAWGGPSMQNGGLTFLEPTSRKLPKGHVIPKIDPSTELAISVGGEDGEPAYLIPSFKYGKYLTDKDAKAEFRKTGEHLGGPFKTWQEADEWERTVRHPYVEKGQNIPTPFRRWGKDFAMGGSLSGPTGMMYARTQSPAPSNGPYAKKTLPSAQNGAEMNYYQQGLDWKPRNISRDGSEIPQAQPGKIIPKWQQRLKEEAAKLDDPLSTFQLMKKGYSKKDAQTIQNAVKKEQPVIQTPKGKQLSEEEIRRKNKQYAEQYGRHYNEKTGAVEAPYSKSLDRLNESMLNAANYAFNVVPKLVQSTYKPNYTAIDALKGKPNDASLVEDIITDPTALASGLLKFGLKGGLGKGLLSSTILPFYKSIPRQGSDAARQSFYSNLDQIKSLLTSQSAKDAFGRVSDDINSLPILSSIDPSYSAALADPNLPVRALDKYGSAMISINPADNALTPEQVKYLDNLGSLYTDYRRINKWDTDIKDRLQFIVENSKNISPRDILPLLHAENPTTGQMNTFLKNLYESYGGQAVNNPMAEYTAATDLLGLADTYENRYAPLSGKIKAGVTELSKVSDAVRPQVIIDDPYFDAARGNNDYAKEAIHLLERGSYQTVPTQPERLKNMRSAGKTVIETVNNAFSDPMNRGRTIVGAHSLSTDSYPLTLSLFSRNKDKFDFIPIHEGTQDAIYPYGNPMSGLSNYTSSRRVFLDRTKGQLDSQFGSGVHQGTSLAGVRQLQGQMIESGYLNHHINKFNQEVGTNMPSAYYSGVANELQRPNVGVIIKKDGGDVVKDDMGYWNPANWGKAVEINSPHITMKGVDRSLIGISDKGDIKYMEPGKDYKFKGKKVTEYPVKKNGGWLDKYE